PPTLVVQRWDKCFETTYHSCHCTFHKRKIYKTRSVYIHIAKKFCISSFHSFLSA
ncbi:hypothetical protein NDU88_004174, partial [Pleurodeles waltl]